jgi:hypothetical protein
MTHEQLEVFASASDDERDALTDEYLRDQLEDRRGGLRIDYGVLTMDAELHIRRQELLENVGLHELFADGTL